MTEIILELAAFLLALFCLVFSLRRSRELYFPLPEGLPGVLKNRHAIFLIILVIFVIDTVVSLIESAMLYLGTWLNVADMLRSVHTVNQIVLLLAFGLYAFRLCSRRQSGGEAGKRDYAAVLLVFAIAVIGVVIQPIWDTHVGLFYEAVSLLGCMALFAQREPGYFDAILMDVRMPEMDGLEAAAAIRALDRENAKTIPIIALTANTFDEDVQRSLHAGMNAHLNKPVEAEKLFRIMGELIYEAEGGE